jgi:ATP-dependent protease ClpP protease subunit
MSEVNTTTMEGLLGVVAHHVNAGVKTIHLLLSTPGGQVNCGISAYNVLKALPVELVTWNTGTVDSIGNVIYLSGARRYAAKNSRFMFHGVSMSLGAEVSLPEKDLRELMSAVQSDNALISGIIAERTNVDAQKLDSLFLEASFLSAQDAKAFDIVHEVRDVEVPPGAPVLQLTFQR